MQSCSLIPRGGTQCLALDDDLSTNVRARIPFEAAERPEAQSHIFCRRSRDASPLGVLLKQISCSDTIYSAQI